MVTDGNDNSSLISLENLVRASQQSGILVYTIGLLSEEEHREANRATKARLMTHRRGNRRPVVFPEGCERSRKDRAPGGARYPQSVHHHLHAGRSGSGRHVSARSGWRPTVRISRWCARAPATTRHRIARSTRTTPPPANAPRALAAGARLQAAAMAKSVSALADRDVLGSARGGNRL